MPWFDGRPRMVVALGVGSSKRSIHRLSLGSCFRAQQTNHKCTQTFCSVQTAKSPTAWFEARRTVEIGNLAIVSTCYLEHSSGDVRCKLGPPRARRSTTEHNRLT